MAHALSPCVLAVIRASGRVALCVLSAALMAAAFPPFDLHWLMWLGFVPLMIGLRGLAPRDAAAFSGLFGIALFSLTVHWLWNLFGAFSTSLFVISAIFPAVFGFLYAHAAQRFSPASLILLTPTLWVATEYLRAEFWLLRFGWGALGYSQVNNEAVLQAASVVGVYGVTWLVVFANALLFWTLTRPCDRGVRMLWLMGSVLAGGVKVNHDTSRKRADRQVVGQLLAACVQGEEVSPDVYAEAAASLGPTDLMVLPEYALAGDPSEDIDAPAFAQIAQQHHTVLIYGAKRYTDDMRRQFRNIALVLGRDGKPLGEYTKRNPVPFFNDGTAGRESIPVETDAGRVGLAVCYDADFERPCREAAANGAQILAVPTFDARYWGEVMHRQHEAMPRFRAVETRRWVLRSASSGYSMIIDPRGEVIAQARTQEPEAIQAQAALRDGLTFYVKWGWLLPRFCLGLTMLLVGAGVAGARRRRR